MKLVFIGASRFGLRCLQTCLDLPSVKIAGVVTAPQTFSISYRPKGVTNVLHANTATLAESCGIPTRMLGRSMNEPGLLDAVSEWNPDVFLVAGWYHMIPPKWRQVAPAYGLHASLLPDYSGGAPLVWAMINGEAKTGITLFEMDDGVDSGRIVGHKEELILPYDTICTLYARIEDSAQELLKEVLPQLVNGTLEFTKQDESQRRIFPQRSPEDGWIDWNQNAEVIDRFIRAQTRPYPGAYTSFDGKLMHVWSASVSLAIDASVPTGMIMHTENNHYLVSTGSKALQLKEISYEQKTYGKDKLFHLFGGGGRFWATRRAA